LSRKLSERGIQECLYTTIFIDKIIGVVHAKDVLPLLAGNAEWTLNDIIRKPYFVPETKKINDLLNELQQKRIQIAIVIDEFGGTAGMVTLEDIVEEIVGEIQDEYDEEKPTVEKNIRYRVCNQCICHGL
jgi:CBS domain containing-hemolysin-like protein